MQALLYYTVFLLVTLSVHAKFMVTSFNISWHISFPEKYVDIVKTYHSYIWIVTQTCLAKYRKLLKMKKNEKMMQYSKTKHKEVIIKCMS